MSYHNPVYLFLFLPAVLLAYQLTPRKRRWILLLFAGYFFFWTISGKLVLYLIGTTFFTHYIGLWLDLLKTSCKEKGEKEKAVRTQYRKKERLVLALGVCTLLGALACLKYYNFFAQNANLILEHAGQRGIFQVKNLLLPVGISFYTLQASVIWRTFIGKRSVLRDIWESWLCFSDFFLRSWKVLSVCTDRQERLCGRAKTFGEKICLQGAHVFCGGFSKR